MELKRHIFNGIIIEGPYDSGYIIKGKNLYCYPFKVITECSKEKFSKIVCGKFIESEQIQDFESFASNTTLKIDEFVNLVFSRRLKFY